MLIDHLVEERIRTAAIYCDGCLLGTLPDAVAGRWPGFPRVPRWSAATEDIATCRKLAADSRLSIVPDGPRFARLGLSQTSVASDDEGSVRLQKRKRDRSRDDEVVAGVLATGAMVRVLGSPQLPRWRYFGAV